jgi:hypothetical protein
MQDVFYGIGASLPLLAGGFGCIILLKQMSEKQMARLTEICLIFLAVPGLMLLLTSGICGWDTDLSRKIVVAVSINLVIVLATVASWYWKEFKW